MKAADVMTHDVKVIESDASVAKAVRLMLNNGFSGLPVVDAQGKLVGMLTEGDLLRRTETGTEKRRPRWLEFLAGPGRLAEEYARTHARRVDDVMTADVTSVGEETPVEQIVQIMERRRIKRVPVVRGGKVVGIVSRANLLRALARLWREPEPASIDDGALRERILAELEKQGWAPRSGIHVSVQNRVVEFTGAIMDERERAALRVLAENIPGVKAVREDLCWVEPMSGWVIEA